VGQASVPAKAGRDAGPTDPLLASTSESGGRDHQPALAGKNSNVVPATATSAPTAARMLTRSL